MGSQWLGPDDAGYLPDIGAVLGELADGRVPAGRAPWRNRGWLASAQSWLVAALATLGRSVCGPVEQVRVAELSCVLRATTGAGDVYFKATAQSPLFVNEGPVMAALADLFAGDVPAPLALDASRRWMLLPDFGPELGWQAPVEVLEEVLRAFARLQIRSAGSIDRLLSVGCFDRTPRWLAGQATGWLASTDLSRWLSSAQAAKLRAAGPDLALRCAELAELPVPCTIGHGDMHLGNVARGGAGGYVFFDWSDACVLHPFVDMIPIYWHADEVARERLRDGYLAEWASFAPPDQLLRAWRLAEPLAALNQAISYASIAAHLESAADPDGLGEETGVWLRRLIDLCRPRVASG